jgi:hypothetical protein
MQGVEETFSDGGLSEGGGETALFGNNDDFDAGDDPGAPLGENVTHDKRERDEATATSKLSAPTPPRPKRQKPIGHGDLMKEAAKLANYASNAPPQQREAVYASLITIREILEGKSRESPAGIVETLQNATSSSMTSAHCGKPKLGPEASKVGAPRQLRLASSVMARNGGTKPARGGRQKNRCKFCGAKTCGNVSTCVLLKRVGARVRLNALGSLVQNDLNPRTARVDEMAKARLVTSEKPVLCSLPKGTKWLVIHGAYDLRTAATAMTQILQEAQTGIEVSCIGVAGVIIDLGNGMNFGNRMAYYSVVRDWIASEGKSSCGKTNSRVILSHDFNTLPMNGTAV